MHRKIKNYGAVVHSKRRLIEMEDKLFRFPSALLKTYLFKLNYNVQSTIMVPETQTQNQVVKFVQKEDLMEKFKYVNSRLNILDKTSLELKVESNEQLTIAENNAKEVVQLAKEVENSRKIMKAPYADVVKMIDSYCKVIDDNFARIKLRFTSEITNFKQIQQAALKAEQDAKLKEVEALEVVKQTEADKIKRIHAQLIARIYGGTYTQKDGTQQNHSGCIKATDCDDLLKWINDSIPAINSFVHFATLYEDTIIEVKKKLAEHRINLYNLELTNIPKLRNEALQYINESRVNAAQEILENGDLVDRKIEKEIKREVNAISNEIKDAGKGVRNVVTWEIQDELLVPRDFLSIDSVKVNAYLNANKEKIKVCITSNEEVVPGIRFFIGSSYIAR